MICSSYHSFFQNFANPTKLAIVTALMEGPLSVNEIVKRVSGQQERSPGEVSQSAVSHNLRKLAACHLLEVRQEGRERIYELNKTVIPVLEAAQAHVATHCKRCALQLQRIGERKNRAEEQRGGREEGE